ncbi:Tetratricopeptide repeat protein 5 [Phlyctochytrium bullatum]|nr:Tetratricopeptide repeat protein 5 [Phlyctochytrium bullatum]
MMAAAAEKPHGSPASLRKEAFSNSADNRTAPRHNSRPSTQTVRDNRNAMQDSSKALFGFDVARDLQFLRIPSEPPLFTTPTLDFSSHHAELLELTLAVLDFVNHYHTRYFPTAPSSVNPFHLSSSSSRKPLPGTEESIEERQPVDRLLKTRRIATAVGLVVSHFNLLTTPNPLHRTTPKTTFKSIPLENLPILPTAGPVHSESPDPHARHNQERPGKPHPSLPPSLVTAPWPFIDSPHPSFDTTLGRKQRAAYHHLRGRLFALLPWPDVRAEGELTRCLKLDPSLVEAWNLLGEWYYGSCTAEAQLDPDLFPTDAFRHRPRFTAVEARRMAKACFERGLEIGRNRKGLLNLAMTLRSEALTRPAQATASSSKEAAGRRRGSQRASTRSLIGTRPQPKSEDGENTETEMDPNTAAVASLLEKSIALCKEALALDVSDGLSWFGIGSSYLKQFFSVSFDPKDLNKALAAYNKAAACPNMEHHPDLYRNRAQIYVYQQQYTNALNDFERSAILDPLESGPDSLSQMRTSLGLVFSFSSAISKHSAQAKARSPEERKTISKSRIPHPFSKLKETTLDKLVVSRTGDGGPADAKGKKGVDANADEVVVVRVLEVVSTGLPRAYVVEDMLAPGAVVGMSIFNLADAQSVPIAVGDQLAVASPLLQQINLLYQEVISIYASTARGFSH